MVTIEQEAWIEIQYGLKIGSRVTWAPAAFKKATFPSTRELMKRDGVGAVVAFTWWDGKPTVSVEFPARKRNNRSRSFWLTTAYPVDLLIAADPHDPEHSGNGETP